MTSKLKRVYSRMPKRSKRRIEEAAAKARLSVSRWARQVMLRAAAEELGTGRRQVKLVIDLPDGKVHVDREK